MSASLGELMIIFLVSISPQGAGAFLMLLTHSALLVLPWMYRAARMAPACK